MSRLLLLLSLLLSACATTFDGRKFTKYDAFDNGIVKVPDHGFMDQDGNDEICDGRNKIEGGYFVTLREPKRGEAEGAYQQYVEAERIRVSVCTKAAAWCTTQLNLFCRLDDDDCLAKNRGGGTRNVCKVRVQDSREKPQLYPVTSQIGYESWIMCAAPGDDYTAPLAEAVLTNQAWKRDPEKWKELCLKHRPEEECNRILQSHESNSYFVEPDASRWAVDILHMDKVEVKRSGDHWFGISEVDLSPACELMEKRH